MILSGTGSDGALGLEAIKAEGGIIFARDAESARFNGMPLRALAPGCVDFVLPPEQIAGELARIGYLDRGTLWVGRLVPLPEAEPGGSERASVSGPGGPP